MNAAWATGVTRVAVLTGAGISTDSGIPDYREPTGAWTRDPGLATAFTYDSFMADPRVRARFWQTYLGHAAWRAQPNVAHRALAGLERAGIAVRVLTQNVDGLHQKAGSSPRKVLENARHDARGGLYRLWAAHAYRADPGPGCRR